MMAGIGVVVATVVFGIALIVFVARSRFARKMELDSSGGKSGVPDDRQQWLGRKGVAVSMLRPSGTGQFDGERLTVLTEGEFVHKGTPIKVVRIEGGKLVVEPAEAQNEAQNEAQKEKPADAQNEAQKEKPKE
jgi:membrane-bound serine protease (ClpP class)